MYKLAAYWRHRTQKSIPSALQDDQQRTPKIQTGISSSDVQRSLYSIVWSEIIIWNLAFLKFILVRSRRKNINLHCYFESKTLVNCYSHLLVLILSIFNIELGILNTFRTAANFHRVQVVFQERKCRLVEEWRLDHIHAILSIAELNIRS